MKKIFEIKKQRSLDAIIEDSFKFFRKHAKKILKIIWEQNRFIILGLAISYFIYVYNYFGAFNELITKDDVTLGPSKMFDTPYFVLDILAMIILGLIFLPRFFSAIAGYMKVYDEQEGKVDELKVKALVKENFSGLIGLTLLIGIVVVIITSLIVFFMVGVMKTVTPVLILILLPVGLLFVSYIIIYITLSYYVYFFENIGVFEVLTKTGKYLKKKFWFSFGVIFVMSLIIGLIGMVLNAPVSIYFLVKTLLMAKNEDVARFAGEGDIIVSIISVLSYAGQTILRILMVIATTFLYFSLREFHTGESLYDKIDKIGVKEDGNNL